MNEKKEKVIHIDSECFGLEKFPSKQLQCINVRVEFEIGFLVQMPDDRVVYLDENGVNVNGGFDFTIPHTDELEYRLRELVSGIATMGKEIDGMKKNVKKTK